MKTFFEIKEKKSKSEKHANQTYKQIQINVKIFVIFHVLSLFNGIILEQMFGGQHSHHSVSS